MKPALHVHVDPPYPVYVGTGLLASLPEMTTAKNIAVVTEERVARHHLDTVLQAFRQQDANVVPIIVPAGESSKSVGEWAKGLRVLAEHAFRRDDCVIALGGGIVGDLAGFMAATYVRGIELIQVPTTVLAMADAAVGGKTGINLPEGKNLVGAFWQPSAVVMDVNTLATLPARVFDQGLVEMFKHGLLAQPSLLEPLLDPSLGPSSSTALLTELVTSSVLVKANVVSQDVHEQGHARATLNLGHTVAHAIEAVTDHRLAHGEAVAWGLLYAAHLSALHRDPDSPHAGAVDWRPWVLRLIDRVDPTPPPALTWDEVLPFLERDKKNRQNARRWVLADAPGRPWLASNVPEELEVRAWQRFVDDLANRASSTPRRATLRNDEEKS